MCQLAFLHHCADCAPRRRRRAPVLDARTAQAIVARLRRSVARRGCKSHAIARGRSMAATSSPRSGWMETAAAFSMAFALAKAKRRRPGASRPRRWRKRAKGTPGFANAPHVVTVAGGAPVCSADGKTRLGAVGVHRVKRPPTTPPAPRRASARRGFALSRLLTLAAALLIGGACRKSIPTPRPRSKGCCSTA